MELRSIGVSLGTLLVMALMTPSVEMFGTQFEDDVCWATSDCSLGVESCELVRCDCPSDGAPCQETDSCGTSCALNQIGVESCCALIPEQFHSWELVHVLHVEAYTRVPSSPPDPVYVISVWTQLRNRTGRWKLLRGIKIFSVTNATGIRIPSVLTISNSLFLTVNVSISDFGGALAQIEETVPSSTSLAAGLDELWSNDQCHMSLNCSEGVTIDCHCHLCEKMMDSSHLETITQNIIMPDGYYITEVGNYLAGHIEVSSSQFGFHGPDNAVDEWADGTLGGWAPMASDGNMSMTFHSLETAICGVVIQGVAASTIRSLELFSVSLGGKILRDKDGDGIVYRSGVLLDSKSIHAFPIPVDASTDLRIEVLEPEDPTRVGFRAGLIGCSQSVPPAHSTVVCDFMTEVAETVEEGIKELLKEEEGPLTGEDPTQISLAINELLQKSLNEGTIPEDEEFNITVNIESVDAEINLVGVRKESLLEKGFSFKNDVTVEGGSPLGTTPYFGSTSFGTTSFEGSDSTVGPTRGRSTDASTIGTLGSTSREDVGVTKGGAVQSTGDSTVRPTNGRSTDASTIGTLGSTSREDVDMTMGEGVSSAGDSTVGPTSGRSTDARTIGTSAFTSGEVIGMTEVEGVWATGDSTVGPMSGRSTDASTVGTFGFTNGEDDDMTMGGVVRSTGDSTVEQTSGKRTDASTTGTLGFTSPDVARTTSGGVQSTGDIAAGTMMVKPTDASTIGTAAGHGGIQSPVSITIPREAFRDVLDEFDENRNGNISIIINVIIIIEVLDSASSVILNNSDRDIGSQIVQVNTHIGNNTYQLSQLNYSVQLKNTTNDTKPVCAFYEEDDYKLGTPVNWNTTGCYRVSGVDVLPEVRCHCKHATSYALLLQLGETDHPPEFAKLLSTVSAIGLTVSIAALTLALLIYYLLRASISSARYAIHSNLMVAILLSSSLFLSGLLDTTVDELCFVCKYLLTYLMLASFCWMLAEGIHLYRLVVTAFVSVKNWLYFAVGWALPAVLTVLAISLTATSPLEPHGSGPRCFYANKSDIWVVVGPVLGIIMVNLLILIRVTLIVIKKVNFQKEKEASGTATQIKAGLRSAFLLMPLLGSMHIIAVITHLSKELELFYNTVNSLQGFFIALFYCILSTEVRNLISTYIRRSKEQSTLGSTTGLRGDAKSRGFFRKNKVTPSMPTQSTFTTNSSQTKLFRQSPVEAFPAID